MPIMQPLAAKWVVFFQRSPGVVECWCHLHPSGAYDPDDLKHEILEAYVKSVGVENVFGFHCYKALPVSFATQRHAQPGISTQQSFPQAKAMANGPKKYEKASEQHWVLAILTANPQGSLLVSKVFSLDFLLFQFWL